MEKRKGLLARLPSKMLRETVSDLWDNYERVGEQEHKLRRPVDRLREKASHLHSIEFPRGIATLRIHRKAM